MLIKPLDDRPTPEDRKLKAGIMAERQMQHYLNRRFGESEQDIFVLNDLRIEDPDRTEVDGSPSVAQIDHLVLHQHGAFIIESKSVSDTVAVEHSEQSGEQWMRVYKGKRTPMPSPIAQGTRQARVLREFLDARRESLLTKRSGVLGVLQRVTTGATASGFKTMPIQIVVAISDNGHLKEPKGWKPDAGEFEASARKADQVTAFLDKQLKRHEDGSKITKADDGDYGIWGMDKRDTYLLAIALREAHKPRRKTDSSRGAAVQPSVSTGSVAVPPSTAGGDRPACKECGSGDLSARSGRYGYYWVCGACSANTTMPTVCGACGEKGVRGKGVRVRKQLNTYFRDCEHCGMSQKIWTEPVAAGS